MENNGCFHEADFYTCAAMLQMEVKPLRTDIYYHQIVSYNWTVRVMISMWLKLACHQSIWHSRIRFSKVTPFFAVFNDENKSFFLVSLRAIVAIGWILTSNSRKLDFCEDSIYDNRWMLPRDIYFLPLLSLVQQ